MKTYRYGFYENVLGEEYYLIQRKTLIFWIDAYSFSSRNKMMEVVNQLKKNNNIVYEA